MLSAIDTPWMLNQNSGFLRPKFSCKKQSDLTSQVGKNFSPWEPSLQSSTHPIISMKTHHFSLVFFYFYF
ncbi:hypothetical protein FKM82_007903 [Ascaphus truei]